MNAMTEIAETTNPSKSGVILFPCVICQEVLPRPKVHNVDPTQAVEP